MTDAAADPGSEHARRMRGALVGALIGAGAGIGWGLWGASGLNGPAAALPGVAAVVVGVVLIVANRRVDRALASTLPPREAAPVTGFDRNYWLVVAAEAIAIAGGVAVVSATGHEAARAPWVCLIVGVHFVVLGRLWHARPILALAAALSLLGLVMLIVALAGAGSAGTVTALTGLQAAAVFFASAAFTVGAATAVVRTGD